MSNLTDTLLRRRRDLAKQLAQLEPLVLRGSLIERYKRCGHAGCKCQQTRGHGPKYYLSVSQAGGRPEMDYVTEEQARQVANYLKNFQEVRRLLEKICNLNRQLLRHRVKF
jgi:uncharacterized protein DUF6788